MRQKIIILLLIFMGISPCVYSASNNSQSELIRKLKKLSSGRVINGTHYSDYHSLTRVVFPDTKIAIKNGVVSSDDFLLKTAEGSFFIVFDNGESIKIAQMTLPVLSHSGKLLIPTETFINSTWTMGFYNDGDEIVEEHNIVASQTENKAPLEDTAQTHIYEYTPADIYSSTALAGGTWEEDNTEDSVYYDSEEYNYSVELDYGEEFVDSVELDYGEEFIDSDEYENEEYVDSEEYENEEFNETEFIEEISEVEVYTYIPYNENDKNLPNENNKQSLIPAFKFSTAETSFILLRFISAVKPSTTEPKLPNQMINYEPDFNKPPDTYSLPPSLIRQQLDENN